MALTMSSIQAQPAKLSNMDQTAHASLDGFLAGIERRAFRMAEMATQDRDEALDIVQDAMMQLARHYGKRDASEWPPLFYRILENKIRDWQRRQSLKRRFFFRSEKPVQDEDEFDPLDVVADEKQIDFTTMLQNDEAMAVLKRALRKLPARQREVFDLRIWEGLSVEETAKAMGCTDGSVKTHLSRALHALRAQLEGVWP